MFSHLYWIEWKWLTKKINREKQRGRKWESKIAGEWLEKWLKLRVELGKLMERPFCVERVRHQFACRFFVILHTRLGGVYELIKKGFPYLVGLAETTQQVISDRPKAEGKPLLYLVHTPQLSQLRTTTRVNHQSTSPTRGLKWAAKRPRLSLQLKAGPASFIFITNTNFFLFFFFYYLHWLSNGKSRFYELVYDQTLQLKKAKWKVVVNGMDWAQYSN